MEEKVLQSQGALFIMHASASERRIRSNMSCLFDVRFSLSHPRPLSVMCAHFSHMLLRLQFFALQSRAMSFKDVVTKHDTQMGTAILKV